MSQNLFFPIYQQLERELIELSYFITFDKKQLTVYSTKIADMLLRTVSEIENISKELCKKEKIKFYDNKKHIKKIVYFNEYFQELEKCYGLSNKLVDFTFDNCNSNIFDMKLSPFKKNLTIKVSGKERKIWSWYNAYNKIKHDRVKNFRQANLENLIYSLSALFLLNVYYIDEVFYDINTYDHHKIIKQIESFSNIFCVDYTIDTANSKVPEDISENSFFNHITYFEIAKEYATYIIYEDKEYKTPEDKGAECLEKLEACLMIYDEDNQIFKKLYDDYKFNDYYTKCKLVAKLNRSI